MNIASSRVVCKQFNVTQRMNEGLKTSIYAVSCLTKNICKQLVSSECEDSVAVILSY